MAVDLKYGRVTLERSTVAEDEVVVVFRARDALLPDLLTEYHRLAATAGSPPHHLDSVVASRSAVVEWQAAHRDLVRVPRSDVFGPQSETFGTAQPSPHRPVTPATDHDRDDHPRGGTP